VLFMERTFMCLVRANRVIEYIPGLKPWAESCSPFGAKPAVMLLNFVPFNPGLSFLGHFGPSIGP
jgi:hypothetical protein